MFVCRKISRAKWLEPVGIPAGAIGADAVTADLKTTRNALSVWTCPVNPHDPRIPLGTGLEDVALVLASGFQRIEKLDLAWMAADTLRDAGVVIESTPGRTPITSLVERHRDLTGLCVERLCVVADAVADALSGQCFRRFTKGEVRRLLIRAINAERLRIEDLEPKVREALSSSL